MDVGQYNIRNKHNGYQPAPTLVSNLRSTSIDLYLNNSTSIDKNQPVLNNSIPKIKKDCKYILECLTALASLAQVLLLPVLFILVLLTQVLLTEQAVPAQIFPI